MPAGGAKYVDVSGRVVLQIEGVDALDLLQRLTTNDLSRLKPGEHAKTLLVNEKGRLIDILTVFRQDEGSIMVTGESGVDARLDERLRHFVVMEDILIRDITEGWCRYVILNAQGKHHDVINQFNLALVYTDVDEKSDEVHCVVNRSVSREFERALVRAKMTSGDHAELEYFRICHKKVAFPSEISESFNPLELGLRDYISFSKGCYVGQEVIARLDTYEKVQRRIERLELSVIPAHLPLALCNDGGETVGVLTSSSPTDSANLPPIGLGVLRIVRSGDRFVYRDGPGDKMGVAKILKDDFPGPVNFDSWRTGPI